MNNQSVRISLWLIGLSLSSVALAQTEVPHTFSAGQPALASEVNENFDTLEQGIQQLESGNAGTYAIGDIGPAGGWVFYVTNDGLHGVEAAPTDIPNSRKWGCVGMEIRGAEGTAIGMGARNTDDIIRDCTEPFIAADAADSKRSATGYYDWYLPSIDELNLMYQNLHDQIPPLGNFEIAQYWSSSEYSGNNALSQFFFNGVGYIDAKNASFKVRAVRAF